MAQPHLQDSIHRVVGSEAIVPNALYPLFNCVFFCLQTQQQTIRWCEGVRSSTLVLFAFRLRRFTSCNQCAKPLKSWMIEFGRYETHHRRIADCMYPESHGPGFWIATPFVEMLQLCAVALSNFGHMWRSEKLHEDSSRFDRWTNVRRW